jgi:hypothetical protein
MRPQPAAADNLPEIADRAGVLVASMKPQLSPRATKCRPHVKTPPVSFYEAAALAADQPGHAEPLVGNQLASIECIRRNQPISVDRAG